MDGLAATQEAPSLREYLQVAQRRKWVIVLGAVLVPFAAIVISFLQQPTYGSSAEVLINRQNIAQTLTGTVDPTASDATRVLGTQVALARLPDVAKRALELATEGEGLTAPRFLRHTSVSEKQEADVLVFTAKAPTQRGAEALATSYARAFVEYRHTLDTSALKQALNEVDQQLMKLRDTGQTRSPLFGSLTVKAQQLQTRSRRCKARTPRSSRPQRLAPRSRLSRTANARSSGSASADPRHRPRLSSRRSTRGSARQTRSSGGSTCRCSRAVRAHRVGSTTTTGSRCSKSQHGPHAEAFRVLRTNLEFFNLDLQARNRSSWRAR